LEEKIEKLSEIDNQNHIYKKTSLINKLPNYLVVQMMRFFWKKGTNIPGQQAGKAKILRVSKKAQKFILFYS
jgi:ubiquitin carboxyl-terminal hydrolase 14